MLLRGFPGLPVGAHESLDTLTHSLVGDGFAECTYTGKDLTKLIVWTDAGKTVKLRETTFSYTVKDLTGVVVQQFNTGELISTLTKTLAYGGPGGNDLISITVVPS